MIAETTATPSAPARITRTALSAVMPPIATSGRRVALRIARSPARPAARGVSVFVGVSKTGLTPR